nr:retrotransposon Orf1 [Tanacetum cinerariifolium]
MSKRSRKSTRGEASNSQDPELVRKFFASFKFKEYHSRTNPTFEGVSFRLGGGTRTMSLLEFGWRVGLYDEEVASHEDTVRTLRSDVTVRREEDWRPFWPTIGEEMIEALSVEQGSRVFPKKSLILMGVVMELDKGNCVWPAVRGVGDNSDDEEDGEETYKNVLQDIRDQLNADAEAVQIILTGIDNDIYSLVDACPNVYEMWKAIERLKQGESINVQDLETNLYWEFRKFTSQDGESLKSYYSRFYKMKNELIRNQCKVTNHQVNIQFLL